jgi:hypothetical protein
MEVEAYSGCFAMYLLRTRGSRQRPAWWLVASENWPPNSPLRLRMARSVSSTCCGIRLARYASELPAAVRRADDRPIRSNIRASSCCSSWATLLLIAGRVRCMRSAAWLNEPFSATAKKAFRLSISTVLYDRLPIVCTPHTDCKSHLGLSK